MELINNEYKQTYSVEHANSSISSIVLKLFPKSHRSTVRCGTSSKVVKSVKNIVLRSNLENESISFNDLPKLLPNNWFILRQNLNEITFGHFLNVAFNGRKPVLHLKINYNGQIIVLIDNKEINLEFIPTEIKLSKLSVAALFRCMNLLQPCYGYEIKQGDEKFAIASKCTKELCKTEDKTFDILRHKECLHVSELNAKVLICKKCSKFIRNKLHYEKTKTENKENETPTYSTSEIMDKIKQLVPNLEKNQLTLIESQIVSSNVSKQGMRWDKDIICMALSLFNRNPAAYRDLTVNNWLNLPSESILSRYKNSIIQGPGIITEMMYWMKSEAVSQKVTPVGYFGGIILDEMAIQEDLQILRTKSGTKLVGLSDSGSDARNMSVLTTGKPDLELANHVLQYIFSGLSGFRWPFAHYPNTQAPPAEIFLTFWSCVNALSEWGFTPVYCSLDGSANNRAFLKMHFPDGNPVPHKLVAKWYKNPTRKMIFMMDPCHQIKKMRNSVLSSGFLSTHQRCLTVNGHVIIWKMWVDAFNWDCCNSFRVHHKLSDEHIFPSNAQKMRNKLAFETLNDDMLNLMTCYAETQNAASQAEMVSVLEFLKYTSILVSLFTDSRPIKDISDTRLKNFSEVYSFFKGWETEHSDSGNKRDKCLMTMETREDMDFLYHGFMSLVHVAINELKTEIVPSRINSDIIENIFCQQRSLYHGANSNPNYNQYRTGINSIVLGQSSTSKKSNAGGGTAKPLAFSLPPKRPKTE